MSPSARQHSKSGLRKSGCQQFQKSRSPWHHFHDGTGLYEKDLRDNGIEVIVPEKDDRDLIAKRILEELELGIVKESTLREFVAIINKMKQTQGIEAVILGCTELPLILNPDNCPVHCLDAVEIHLEKLISLAVDYNS